MRYKAVLFDMDGTVIDTNELILNAWQAVAEAMEPGLRFTKEDVISYYGRTLEEAVVLLAKKLGKGEVDVEKMSSAYWSYHMSHHHEITGVYPGMKEALEALKDAGIKTGIVTSGINQSCSDELAEFGIRECFDVIVGGDDVSHPKPAPDPALLCCERLGTEPEEALMVGDSRHDIACGNRAGCRTALVSWTWCPQDDLLPEERADFLLNSPEELLDLIVDNP